MNSEKEVLIAKINRILEGDVMLRRERLAELVGMEVMGVLDEVEAGLFPTMSGSGEVMKYATDIRNSIRSIGARYYK